MCGRYRLTAKERYLRDHFGLDEDFSWTPRWNIAPTQQVPIIRQNAARITRSFKLVRWGLIPSWAKALRWPASLHHPDTKRFGAIGKYDFPMFPSQHHCSIVRKIANRGHPLSGLKVNSPLDNLCREPVL